MMAMEEHITASTPLQHRRVKCPTCRLRVHVNDIALARSGGAPPVHFKDPFLIPVDFQGAIEMLFECEVPC
jgi:hypothetical protein